MNRLERRVGNLEKLKTPRKFRSISFAVNEGETEEEVVQREGINTDDYDIVICRRVVSV